ncbi:MAG: nucleotidyltransferase family protein [Oscillospiraceae bacterium]|nr:nucleotidyltransferase family protein [Oscillospiraceae bacterium]
MDLYLQYGGYLAKLLASLIKSETPPKPTFDLDWEKFFEFCKSHKVENMVYSQLKNLNLVPKETLEKFGGANACMCVAEAKQEILSQKIFSAFEREKVSYLPLKGIVIKKLYPVENYRTSNDVDILVKQKDFQKAEKVLQELGYSFLGESNRDNDYHKGYSKGVVHIELHSHLTPRDSLQREYFNTAFDRAVCSNINPYRFDMTDEDLYIYTLYHLYKHFVKGGVGVRYFLDMYILKDKLSLDMCYVENELQKIGLKKFEKTVTELSQVFFDNSPMDNRLKKLARFVYVSGAHGATPFYVVSKFSGEGTSKNHSFINRVKFYYDSWFIGRKAMSIRYPILNKHGFLLPFCYIHKGIYTLFCKPEAIKEQADKMVNVYNKNAEKYVENINRLAGL